MKSHENPFSKSIENRQDAYATTFSNNIKKEITICSIGFQPV